MAARSNLEDEFREFVAARSTALLRTAYLLAGDWATAEDLLQTALTKTYLAWKRLGEIEAVEPYARRVLVNTATSWWRRRWHGERPTEVLPERPAPDQIEEQLERDALWRHVRTLPARQRAVLVLRFYEDMTEAQTAAMLNISPGTVKSQTFRALNTLRRRLGAEPGTEAALAARTAAGVGSDGPARTGSSANRVPGVVRTGSSANGAAGPARPGPRAVAPVPRRVPAAPRTAPSRLPVTAIPGASAPPVPATGGEGR